MKKYDCVARAFFALSFVLVHLCSAEQCANCSKPTGWEDLNSFTLKMTTPGTTDYSVWEGQFDKSTNDIQIDVETSEGGKVVKGKLLMIGGRVMAMQGPIAEPGYEIDAMDAPALELQLIFKLLDRVLSNGPSSVQSPQKLDYTDNKSAIQLATPSAQGAIQAPWHVVGEVKLAEAGAILYQVTLTSRANDSKPGATNESVIGLTGSLSKSQEARLNDQLSLESWKLFGVGVQSRKQQNSTYYDYSAAPEKTNYKTVADVRNKLAEQDYPGEADSSRNFTGFWKTNCENAFGLRIMHYGSD